MNSDDEIIPSHMFDRIMERFDKLESRMDANARRLGKLWPPSHPKPLYSQPPARQPSGWDPPPHRAARRYSSYDQPRRPTCWDPPLYRKTPYTHMDSSYAPRQYTTANFGQPPYSSDESQRKPYAGYHRGQHEYQPSPPPYRPPRSPTCWESPEYVPPIPLGCPPPHAVESRRLSHPHLLHDPSSSSLPAALAVPPPPLQRSPSCCPTSSASPLPAAAAAAVPSVNWSPPAPPCSPDISVEEGELLHDGPPPPAPILQLYNPYISEEEESSDNLGRSFLIASRFETEVDEVDDHGASNLDVAGVSNPSIALLCANHGVEEDRDASPESHQVSSLEDIYLPCCSDETTIISTTPLPAVVFLHIEGDFRFLLQEIAYDEGGVCLRIGTPLVQEYIGKNVVYVADVCGTLGAYSSFRPKRITSGRVMDQEFDYEENLGLLQLDLHVPDAEVCEWRRSPFDDHISPPLLIFYGGDEGRSSVVRYAFDPGGYVSPKLLLSTLVVGSWFPP